MFKSVLSAAILGLALAAGAGAANAQTTMPAATAGVQLIDYRVGFLPRPVILSQRQIIARLRAAGWWNIRGLDRHTWYYTARANSWRGSYSLVINGLSGRVISAKRIDYRRW